MGYYENWEAFCGADERRRGSEEALFGAWRTNGQRQPKCRVRYARATGEVYALVFGAVGVGESVQVLAVVPPDEGERWHRTLDRILNGWVAILQGAAYRGKELESLQWVRDRLARAATTHPGGTP